VTIESDVETSRMTLGGGWSLFLIQKFMRLIQHRRSTACVRWVNRELAIGAPIEDADWRAVRALGVRGVVDLSTGCGDLGPQVRQHGMRDLRRPVSPGRLPEAEELHIVTSWVLQRISEEGAVLINDTSIRGNDALVAATALVKRGASVRTAALQAEHAAMAPLTDAQLEVLERFAGQLMAVSSRG
jgi:hypothetical protein